MYNRGGVRKKCTCGGQWPHRRGEVGEHRCGRKGSPYDASSRRNFAASSTVAGEPGARTAVASLKSASGMEREVAFSIIAAAWLYVACNIGAISRKFAALISCRRVSNCKSAASFRAPLSQNASTAASTAAVIGTAAVTCPALDSSLVSITQFASVGSSPKALVLQHPWCYLPTPSSESPVSWSPPTLLSLRRDPRHQFHCPCWVFLYTDPAKRMRQFRRIFFLTIAFQLRCHRHSFLCARGCKMVVAFTCKRPLSPYLCNTSFIKEKKLLVDTGMRRIHLLNLDIYTIFNQTTMWQVLRRRVHVYN